MPESFVEFHRLYHETFTLHKEERERVKPPHKKQSEREVCLDVGSTVMARQHLLTLHHTALTTLFL